MKKIKQLIAVLVVALCLVTTVSDTCLPVSVYAASTTETTEKINVKKLKIKLSKTTFTYNGKEQKPKVTVTYKGKKVKSENYTVKYSSGRKLPGTYKVTVTLKGKYTGKKTLKYKIELKAPTVKVSKTTDTAITLKWAKTAKSKGYVIYNSKKKKIASTKKTSYTVKNLTSGKKYTFYVRSYSKVGKKTYYSAYAKVSSATSPIIIGAKTLYIGDTYTYKVKTNSKVSWSVDDEEIAEINSKGKLTAYEEGVVEIIAKANGVTSSFETTIKKPSIELNYKYLTINTGTTLKLSTTVAPTNMNIEWETDNGSIVAVSQNGTITANSPGTATIKSIGYYKNYEYEDYCVITVKEAPTTEPSTTAPTEPPIEESAFDILKNYILEYGYENSYGNNFILEESYSDGYTDRFGIIYDSYDNKLVFTSTSTQDNSTWFDYSVEFKIDSSTTSTSVEGIIVYYENYALTASGKAFSTINFNTFTSDTDLKFYWESGSADFIVNGGGELLNSRLHWALKEWDILTKKSCGVSLKDFGFTSYTFR